MEVKDWHKYWHEYRRTTGELTWRMALPSDLPAIRRLRNVSERFLNTPQRRISLFEKPVLLALVAVNPSGKIVDCIFLEAIVEISKMACAKNGFEEGAGLEEDLATWLRAIGFKTVCVTASARMKPYMEGTLARLGFKALAETMHSLFRRRL